MNKFKQCGLSVCFNTIKYFLSDLINIIRHLYFTLTNDSRPLKSVISHHNARYRSPFSPQSRQI